MRQLAAASFCLAVLALLSSCKRSDCDALKTSAYAASGGEGHYPEGSVVALHGRLHVEGTQLCDEAGAPVLLRGVSTHNLKHFSAFANPDSVAFLANNWGVTVIRAAMYSDAYVENHSIERAVDILVEECERNGIYCIIDWHVLRDRNPGLYVEQAKEFFARKSLQYSAKKHVIYEICNEPNGDEVTWKGDIKPYAEAVIPEIRKNAPDSVILVGCARWSQNVDECADDPLAFDNLMYVLHFYAGTHMDDLKDKLRYAAPKIPIFCSEWGSSNADGDGGPFIPESKAWLDLVEGLGISWCTWSMSDAREASAILKPGSSPRGGWTDADLKPSGIFLKECLRR
jgi:endoglucanase